jgi:hypothetical protein
MTDCVIGPLYCSILDYIPYIKVFLITYIVQVISVLDQVQCHTLVEVQFHTITTFSLERSERQPNSLTLYLQGKSPDSHRTGDWIAPRASLHVVDYSNIPVPPEKSPLINNRSDN